MIVIEIQKRLSGILLRVICGVLLAGTVALLVFSLLFSFGGEAPSILGKNVYIVHTDAFSVLKNGTAAITAKVPFDEILPGNIVIFENSNKKIGIAEIQSRETSDGVYTFFAKNDRGTDLILSQGQIVGKAMQYSDALGTFIQFAVSPAGVLVIAVLPCVTLFLFEVAKAVQNYLRDKRGVHPVRKQDDLPTFVPKQKVNAAIEAYSKREFDEDERYDYDLEEEVRRKTPAYRASDLINLDKEDGFEADSANNTRRAAGAEEVFANRYRSPAAPEPVIPKTEGKKPMPLSQKRLNQIMAETKAKKDPSNGLNALIAKSSQPSKPSKPSRASKPVTEQPMRKPAAVVQAVAEQDRLLRSEDDEGQGRLDALLASEEPLKRPERENKPEKPQKTTARIIPDPKLQEPEPVKRFTPRKSTQRQTVATATIPRLDQVLRDESETENTRYNIEDILSSFEKKERTQ